MSLPPNAEIVDVVVCAIIYPPQTNVTATVFPEGAVVSVGFWFSVQAKLRVSKSTPLGMV